MAVSSPVTGCECEWFSVKQLSITIGTGLFILLVTEVFVTGRHRKIGKWQRTTNIYVTYMEQDILLNVSVVKCKVTPTCTDHSIKFSS